MEVIISVTLLAVVAGTAYVALGAVESSWGRGLEKIDTQQNLRIAMDRMTREARAAQEVLAPLPGEAAGAVLEMRYAVTQSQPNDSGTGEIKYEDVKYHLQVSGTDADQIVLHRDVKRKTSPNWLGHNVVAYGLAASGFTVQQPQPGLVVVKLTAAGGGYTLETKVRLRAAK